MKIPSRILWLVALSICTSPYSSLARGQEWPTNWTKPPEGRLGEAWTQWYSVVAQNDNSALERYLDDTWSPRVLESFGKDRVMRFFRQLADSFETTEISGFELTATRITARCRNVLTDEWFSLYLEVDSDTFKVKDVDTQRRPVPTEVLQKPLNHEDLRSELQSFFETLEQRDMFSGSVLIAQGDAPLFREAFGRSIRRYDVPNHAETKYCLGSMTKMFTAVAIARLIENEILTLDDRVSDYLGEEWIPSSLADRIQIKHLLTHTSGIGDFFTHPDYPIVARTRFRTVSDYAPFIEESRLAFEPGSQWRYSNSGYILLGAIIEQATEGDYFEFMDEEIFETAGMEQSGFYETDRPEPDLAIGYFRDEEGQWRNNLFTQRVRGCPAGSSYSSVDDLLRFSLALQGGDLLTEESKALFCSPKPQLGSPNYGFGFSTRSSSLGMPSLGHSGGGPGVRAFFRLYPDNGYTVAVLTNYTTAYEAVIAKIETLLARHSKSS